MTSTAPSAQSEISKTKPTDPQQVQIGGDHYKQFVIQPAEFSTRNGLPFLEGCVIKRMCRHQHKDENKALEDLRKAIHEIRLIALFQYGVKEL